MPQKSFSELKKQVRTAEEVRLIRTLVDNVPMKFHRRVGGWGTVGSLGIIAPIWIGDAGEVYIS